MTPFTEAHSSKDKGLWGSPKNPQKPDSLLPQATLTASLPGWDLPLHGKPERNGPDQDPLQSQKTLTEALFQVTQQVKGCTWKVHLEGLSMVTYYMLLHETELNHLKIVGLMTVLQKNLSLRVCLPHTR